jgi:hypothetical protein
MSEILPRNREEKRFVRKYAGTNSVDAIDMYKGRCPNCTTRRSIDQHKDFGKLDFH